MNTQSVFIYGAGRVGRALGRAIEAAGPGSGLTLVGAWNRRFARALRTSQLLDVPASAGDALPEGLPRADIVLMSVVDDAVADTAKALGRHLSARQILLHTSGSLSAQTMASDTMRAHVGCAHPLQALADDDGDPTPLQGAIFAVEGDQDALMAARRVAVATGGEPVEVRSSAKVLYHAAAVMSANYQTALVDVARTLLGQAGVDARTAIRMLTPLLEGTLTNLRALNDSDSTLDDDEHGRRALARALTGPIRRGDAGTVKRHLKALKKLAKRDPQTQDLPQLYRLLGRHALDLAVRADLREEDAQQLRALLHDTTGAQ